MRVTSAVSSVRENRSPTKCTSTVSSATTTSETRNARSESRSGFGEIGESFDTAPATIPSLSSLRASDVCSARSSASIWLWIAGARSDVRRAATASCAVSWSRWVWIGWRSLNFCRVCWLPTHDGDERCDANRVSRLGVVLARARGLDLDEPEVADLARRRCDRSPRRDPRSSLRGLDRVAHHGRRLGVAGRSSARGTAGLRLASGRRRSDARGDDQQLLGLVLLGLHRAAQRRPRIAMPIEMRRIRSQFCAMTRKCAARSMGGS